jgi:hypothetical protein
MPRYLLSPPPAGCAEQVPDLLLDGLRRRGRAIGEECGTFNPELLGAVDVREVSSDERDHACGAAVQLPLGLEGTGHQGGLVLRWRHSLGSSPSRTGLCSSALPAACRRPCGGFCSWTHEAGSARRWRASKPQCPAWHAVVGGMRETAREAI